MIGQPVAGPLITFGDPSADVCVDGWCGPIDSDVQDLRLATVRARGDRERDGDDRGEQEVEHVARRVEKI